MMGEILQFTVFTDQVLKVYQQLDDDDAGDDK